MAGNRDYRQLALTDLDPPNTSPNRRAVVSWQGTFQKNACIQFSQLCKLGWNQSSWWVKGVLGKQRWKNLYWKLRETPVDACRFAAVPPIRFSRKSARSSTLWSEHKERSFQQIGRLGASYQSRFIVPCSSQGWKYPVGMEKGSWDSQKDYLELESWDLVEQRPCSHAHHINRPT